MHSDVYGMFNYAASLASSEYILFVNDDMYFPGKLGQKIMFTPNTVVTFIVVEPGIVKVDKKNIEHSFGTNWHKFNKTGFEQFAKNFPKRNQTTRCALGWYIQVLFPKKLLIENGKYPNDPSPKQPNDIQFFNKLLSNSNVGFLQLNSPIYHFQRLSQRKYYLITELRIKFRGLLLRLLAISEKS